MKLTKDEVIRKYNISDATLKNWISLGLEIENNRIDENKLKKFIEKHGKLTKRANRTNNKNRNIPSEFFNFIDKNKFEKNISIIDETDSDLDEIIETLLDKRIEIILRKEFKNPEYVEYLKKIKRSLSPLDINFDLEDNNLIVGLLYQYTMGVKRQSTQGAYYTPFDIIDKIVPDEFDKTSSFLDPACGSGYILFKIFEKYKKLYPDINPLNYIYGNDIDFYSTLISIIELIDLAKNEEEFVLPKIFNKDGLKLDDDIVEIDYVITNPPYGAKIKNKWMKQLTGSNESFIYFLYKAISFYTNDKGKIHMVLPTSLLTTLTYKYNRLYLVEAGLYRIEFLGKKFKGVMSDIILVYIDKEKVGEKYIEFVDKDGKIIEIDKQIILDNPFHIINKYQTRENYIKYKKLLENEHYYLNADDFYLGIVTGSNNSKIKNKKDEKYCQEVIMGKNFDNDEKYYINPNDRFQQVPKDMSVYKRDKIVYKFISNRIKTKVDFNGKYTINSVNIYAPENVSKDELKRISKQLNSDTTDFILKFLFGDVTKILKEYLISIPIFKG